jgi:peroxiredoxin
MIFACSLSSRRLRILLFAIVVALAALVLSGSPAKAAEFKAGQVIPDFSLSTPEGTILSLKSQKGQATITYDRKVTTPAITVIHLFQPDCFQCQTQMRALEALHQEFNKKNVMVIGIAHRGDGPAVSALARHLQITFPLLVGTGSPLAHQFAAGDTLAIADKQATVRFAQVGYGKGDESIWREGIRLLLDGKPPSQTTVPREGLKVGDPLPAIELPSLQTDKLIALTGEDGRLAFRDEQGKVVKPKVAIGMFSRL